MLNSFARCGLAVLAISMMTPQTIAQGTPGDPPVVKPPSGQPDDVPPIIKEPPGQPDGVPPERIIK